MIVASRLLPVVVMAGCAGKPHDSASEHGPVGDPTHLAVPAAGLAAIATDSLCVTRGAAAIGHVVTSPNMRAIARGSSGEAASLTFTFRGETDETSELGSGNTRRQLGLKLRAANGCNVVYVMWRLDPTPKLEVSIKRNAGATDHAQCGTAGYTKLKAAASRNPPVLESGATHALDAEIAADELRAWIDGELVWRGALPTSARELTGPAGLRSDNLAFELVAFRARPGATAATLPTCVFDEPRAQD